MVVYGIKNCNTVKKVLDFLNEKEIKFEFHDYKKQGITLDKLTEWEAQIGSEKLLNKAGTTWKKQDETVKASVVGVAQTLDFLLKNNSAIKRPIVELNNKIVALGYNEEELGSL